MPNRDIWNAFGSGTLLEDGRRYGPKKTQDSFGKRLKELLLRKASES